MARYLGGKARIAARLNTVLPGLTKTFKLLKPNQTRKPGQHRARVSEKKTQYLIRLEEKQKIRFNYGLSEKQLTNYIKRAKKIKGITGTILLQLVEMRLDNILFRLHFAPTIAAARQLVTHGHIVVNKKSVSRPSYECQPGDTLSIKDHVTSIRLVKENLKSSNSRIKRIPKKIRRKWKLPLTHLRFNRRKLTARIVHMINLRTVPLTVEPEPLNERLVIEYYSKKI